MPKQTATETILGRPAQSFGQVAGTLFARKGEGDKKEALRAFIASLLATGIDVGWRNLQDSFGKKVENVENIFNAKTKQFEENYTREILPLLDIDRQAKDNPNYWFQKAQKEIYSGDPNLPVNFDQQDLDNLDSEGQAALKSYIEQRADAHKIRHAQLMENPLAQRRTMPEFTQEVRDEYTTQLNALYNDPKEYRLFRNVLDKIDLRTGSGERHTLDLQAGVNRAMTKRMNFEADLRALMNAPPIKAEDSSYLDDLSFQTDFDISWKERRNLIDVVAGELQDHNSIFGKIGGNFYTYNNKLELPKENGVLQAPTANYGKPFDNPLNFMNIEIGGEGLADIEVWTINDEQPRRDDGTYNLEQVDFKKTGLGPEQYIAQDLVALMIAQERREQKNAERMSRTRVSESDIFASVSGDAKLKEDALHTLRLTGHLLAKPNREGWIYIPLSEKKDITRVLPKEKWWVGRLKNDLFKERENQAIDGMEFIDLALEGEEANIIDQLNFAESNEERERLNNRLDMLTATKRNSEGQPQNAAIHATEMLKLLFNPQLFGIPEELLGQPLKFDNQIYELGGLTRGQKELLYKDYQNTFGRRNAELELLLR